MRRARKTLDFEEASLNLTPLIDVVFVILIMFIVIAPLIDSDRIQLASAKETGDQKKTIEPSPITIHVYADNTIALNKQKVSLEQFRAVLPRVKQSYPTARVQLFHDQKATFGTYQTIKNALEAAGFAELDVILKPNA